MCVIAVEALGIVFVQCEHRVGRLSVDRPAAL